ncbi:MAG TPA: hypothetical protein VL122_10715 [Nitrospirota bacterium]|nr:hypothetical protein [Nitrospirota bacterium]
MLLGVLIYYRILYLIIYLDSYKAGGKTARDNLSNGMEPGEAGKLPAEGEQMPAGTLIAKEQSTVPVHLLFKRDGARFLLSPSVFRSCVKQLTLLPKLFS